MSLIPLHNARSAVQQAMLDTWCFERTSEVSREQAQASCAEAREVMETEWLDPPTRKFLVDKIDSCEQRLARANDGAQAAQ